LKSGNQNNSLFGEPSPSLNAFGETPKAMGDDARAPQSNLNQYGLGSVETEGRDGDLRVRHPCPGRLSATE
jgi:hypothetical protein